jgi:hypothetical protein
MVFIVPKYDELKTRQQRLRISCGREFYQIE